MMHTNTANVLYLILYYNVQHEVTAMFPDTSLASSYIFTIVSIFINPPE